MLTLQQITDAAHEVAKYYPITKIVLFGSYAAGRNTQYSDVDLIVEFETSSVSLLTLSDIKYRIQDIFGVDVDVIHGPLTEASMIEINEAVEIYAA